jgi:hypothetical protein
MIMSDDSKTKLAGTNTHENVLVPCVGRFSNTGMTTFFTSIEVIKALGLQKVDRTRMSNNPGLIVKDFVVDNQSGPCVNFF